MRALGYSTLACLPDPGAGYSADQALDTPSMWRGVVFYKPIRWRLTSDLDARIKNMLEASASLVAQFPPLN